MKLLTKSSTKTLKGEKYGWETYILYMSPAKQNSYGKNLCSQSTEGCRSACLYNAGRGVFTSVQQARVRKADWFIKDSWSFMSQLYKELVNLDKRREKNKLNICVRFNGTTDIPIENIKLYEYGAKNIMELFPEIVFYDYTKISNRFNNVLPRNYHLTFSYSGENKKEALQLLKKGHNVSVVFDTQKSTQLPKRLWNHRVYSADESDLRFLDKKLYGSTRLKRGMIGGLTYKIPRGKKVDITNSKFVVKL